MNIRREIFILVRLSSSRTVRSWHTGLPGEPVHHHHGATAPSLPDGLIVPEVRHTDAEEVAVADEATPFPPIRNTGDIARGRGPKSLEANRSLISI